MSMKPTWGEVLAWTKREIETARTDMEAHGLSHEDTERLRCRITIMRELQAMTEIKPAPEALVEIPYT